MLTDCYHLRQHGKIIKKGKYKTLISHLRDNLPDGEYTLDGGQVWYSRGVCNCLFARVDGVLYPIRGIIDNAAIREFNTVSDAVAFYQQHKLTGDKKHETKTNKAIN